MNNTENNKSIATLREEAILKFWQQDDTFNKSLKKDSPAGEFVFYEGPPTANGMPGIHHLEARAFKDAIPRYKTMRGYHVNRKGGWDTHGLPVELQVEKKLGLNTKKAIEEYGIASFNKQCKESVWQYLDVWNKFTERIGYWVDKEKPYITYHNKYIESVWNVLKKVDEQNLLYKDYKVVPWCPRCGTALSSHELAQGYETVKDLSVYAKFKVVGQDNTYILAWTTTPWTLPGNVALAVGKDIIYVEIKVGEEVLILAKERISVVTEAYEIIAEYKSEQLVDVQYEPLYPYLTELISDVEKIKLEKTFRVYVADFVNTTDGTGIVHTAVMYGQDDFELGTKEGLPKHHLVGLDGKFVTGTGIFEGRNVRDEDVAVDVIKDLAHRGLLFKKEKYEHSYPHCWRCKTALIYYARDSWYIRMSDSKIKDKLISENTSINWEPSYIRDGRFGEWLKDIKDWAISRERYWGTPLPIWQKSDGSIEVIGSQEELRAKTKSSQNKYFVMRHGQTHHNIDGVVSISFNNGDHLTDLGKDQATKSAELLNNEKIDIIISSPFVRTRETAEIVASIVGIESGDIVYDERLHEMSIPMYEGKTWAEYHADFPKIEENFNMAPEGNESYMDVKNRVMSFMYEIEKKYSNKNILIITHGGPAWLTFAGAKGYTANESLEMIRDKKDFHYMDNCEFAVLDFVPLPHNENYELDFHKPYIDEITLVSEDGEDMKRVKEVMDVWFDSGAMPFAQNHYPFENKDLAYPADFICEAIDQTRGWFYTLHAIGVLMGKGKAYKNVICLGHILDGNGKKMSKSLGNIVDPEIMINKYGVDTLRLWMYSVNQPGESKNFDEKTVALLHQQVFGLLYNVLAFYELYRDDESENSNPTVSSNVLDQWILTRLDELVVSSTANLDNYKLLEPVRALRDFVDDLSTWYLRRSRDRIKNGDIYAKATLYFVLKTITKIMAPFAPFTAEDIWQKLKKQNDESSVHLSNWPELNEINNNVINEMKTVRQIVTAGLEARQKAGIKVRQPLGKLKIKNYTLKGEYNEILKDELNVKDIVVDDSIENLLEIDTHITLELRTEGNYRELVRAIQDMRKKQGLSPNDVIVLEIQTGIEGQEIISLFKDELLKTVGAKEIKLVENQGQEVKIEELLFSVNIVL